MLRSQDILFGILGVALAALMALHIEVIVLALVGAFACGAIYVFAAMIPTREESFLQRAFTSAFLAIVVSSLVLILPGTLGAPHPELRRAVIAIAAALPLAALCFEVARTPRVIQAILRCLGYR
jgi:hypothetical protein